MSEQTEQEERFHEELKRDIVKWRIRRRIAISAFCLVVFIAIFYMFVPLAFGLSLETVGILSEFNPIIISVIGLCSSIVMLYIGAATYSDTHGNKMSS